MNGETVSAEKQYCPAVFVLPMSLTESVRSREVKAAPLPNFIRQAALRAA